MLDQSQLTTQPLAGAVHAAVQRYFDAIGDAAITNLYDMLFEQVEPALLEAVMPYCHHNQVRAAKALGLSRGTLRKKLRQYFGNKSCGERETS